MADSFAAVTIVGNVGRDPELKKTKNGNSFARVAIATNRNYQDDRGEWQAETTWYSVELWGKAAEIAAERVRKGMLVSAAGMLSQGYFTGDDGVRRSRLDVRGCQKVYVLEKRDRAGSEPPAPAGAPVADAPMLGATPEDELPF
jgi:single-strand DNA-binding protein